MLDSRRKAIAITLGWWLLRRRLRKGAGAAVAGLLAGEGLQLAAPRKRHRLRNLLLVAGIAAAGVFVWRRLQGGTDDDWGTWEPEPPARPEQPAPAFGMTPEPGATAA